MFAVAHHDGARHDADDGRLQVRPDAGGRRAGGRRRGWPSWAARACCSCAGTPRTRTARVCRSPSRAWGRGCEEVFARCRGRIVVTCFASNIHRVQQVVDAAAALDRRVSLVGRSMRKNTNIGRMLGHIDIPEGMLVGPKEIEDFPDEKLVIISTGSPGRAAVRAAPDGPRRPPERRAARRRHRDLLGHADPRQRARGERDDRPDLPAGRERDHPRATCPCTPRATATPRS